MILGMDGATFVALVGAMLATCSALVTAYFTYHAQQAQVRAQAVSATTTATVTGQQAEMEHLRAQSEQLRQGLLAEIARLTGKEERSNERMESLERRVRDLEDENTDLRIKLRRCLERPNDLSGAPVERRGGLYGATALGPDPDGPWPVSGP